MGDDWGRGGDGRGGIEVHLCPQSAVHCLD